MKRHTAIGNVVPLHAAGQEPRIAVSIGVAAEPRSGEMRVALVIGQTAVFLTPERAEEYAVDLRTAAIEVRNGGARA